MNPNRDELNDDYKAVALRGVAYQVATYSMKELPVIATSRGRGNSPCPRGKEGTGSDDVLFRLKGHQS